MIYLPELEAPTWSFPSAFPGLGIYQQDPVTGQHATNPTRIRTHTIRRKGANPHIRVHSSYWQYWDYNLPTGPFNPRTWAIFAQKSLTRYWKNTLTPTQRSAWATLASQYTAPNIYGQTRNLSGFGLWLHANWIWISVNNASIAGPPYFYAPQWTDPPSTWLSLTAPAFTTLQATATGPAGYAEYPPFIALYAFTTDVSPSNLGILSFYLGHPGEIISARKQANIAWAGAFIAEGPGPLGGYLYCTITNPTITPGTTITVASKYSLYPEGGESPMTFTQLTLQPYPLP